MKNWFSWMVVGSIAVGFSTYSSMGEPLADAWVFDRWMSQLSSDSRSASSDSESDHDNPEYGSSGLQGGDLSSSIGGGRSRLVQQRGARFGDESSTDSHRSHQRNHYTTLRAFRDSVGDHWKSTVQILDANKQVAMGAIVSADGWIVSKSSEIPDQKVEVRLFDNSKAEGTVKLRRTDLDLALIKIERSNLLEIQWNTGLNLRAGSWLATTDIRNLPLAIGVVSVVARNVKGEKPVLGVQFGTLPSGESGALVVSVIEGSGADRAGVQAGDVIVRIQGDTLKSEREIRNRLETFQAGQTFEVDVVRDGKQVPITAQMMDLGNSLHDSTEMEVNGDISSRSTSFQNVMQHDSVISPHQCGGPLVDVNGNAVGLNIARAGRVSSYAIPARFVSNAVSEMLVTAGARRSSTIDNNVAKASAQSSANRSAAEVPNSVPPGIVIETLKPEFVVPGTRRQ